MRRLFRGSVTARGHAIAKIFYLEQQRLWVYADELRSSPRSHSLESKFCRLIANTKEGPIRRSFMFKLWGGDPHL